MPWSSFSPSMSNHLAPNLSRRILLFVAPTLIGSCCMIASLLTITTTTKFPSLLTATFKRTAFPLPISPRVAQAAALVKTTREESFQNQGCFSPPKKRKERQRGGNMSWTCHGVTNQDMVETLQERNVLQSSRAASAMKEIDRAEFVLSKDHAYVDTPQPIGYNATISAPHMHAYCLTLLEDHLHPGMRVLDVGSGSGYLAAVMAVMVGETGRVVGVEHIPELAERSIKSIQMTKAAPYLEKGTLSIHASDGRRGFPSEAPYDAIHVGAAAAKLPEALVEQLRPGGRLVIPVGSFFQELEVIDKGHDGSVKKHSAMGVRYVPLTERNKQLAGV